MSRYPFRSQGGLYNLGNAGLVSVFLSTPAVFPATLLPMPIARVVVDMALDREFDYSVPEELVSLVGIGSRVRVPFGHSVREGFVVGMPVASPHSGLKPLSAVLDPKPLLNQRMIELARWMGSYYCATFEQAVRALLPATVRARGVRYRTRQFVSVTAEGNKALEDHSARLTAGQRRLLELVRNEGKLPVSDLGRRHGLGASAARTLERRGLVRVTDEAERRDPNAGRTIVPTAPLELMPEQSAALAAVIATVEECSAGGAGPHVVLLHGVTGSGKTEVYLQAISHVLGKGRTAIVLVPEISLTPQTVERFRSRFGDRVAVLHSHLSEGERHDEWHRIQDGRARIVVGARSAVFAPVSEPGLVVVDEEHEPSYKQEEAPRYNARDVAVMRGRLESCAVVLGSATPSLESWHNATRGKYRLVKLTHRVDHRRMPLMRVVDMRVEAGAKGKTSVLSRALVEAIRMRLDSAEQTILFLNRRGYSTSLVCGRCGHVEGCAHCSVAMTYHRSEECLRCHMCGASSPVPASCPGCGDPGFRYSGVGTQRVESVVKKCFPKARVQRMDADATTRKDAYERILGDFRTGQIDILVGTQMIAKGLHFPNVTLVGIVYADVGLHMPDFRAGERSFQLLAQVAGRAGRGEVPGEVIVQTCTPFHNAVQAARRLDYEGFCDQEIEFRRELGYPPFRRLVCITFRGLSDERVSFACAAFAKNLKPRLDAGAELSEPCAAPLARVKGHYRHQLMLRSGSVNRSVAAIRETVREIRMPRGVMLSVDVDAMSLL